MQVAGKDSLQQHAKVVHFMLIDGADKNAIGFQQAFCKTKTLLHH